MLSAIAGEPGPARDIVALNAGAAIYTGSLADSHEAGVRRALEVMSSGAATRKLDEFVAFTRAMA